MCDVFLPYLQDEDDGSTRLTSIAGLLREWTVEREGVNENLAKCNRTFTRFTTSGMSIILPDIPDAPSGWNTENHYFYEIVNRTGKSIYIQFAISARNATDEFLSKCESINQFYPSKFDRDDWQWRTPFRTQAVTLDEDLSKEQVFSKLDECLEEVQTFEQDLKQKLGIM